MALRYLNVHLNVVLLLRMSTASTHQDNDVKKVLLALLKDDLSSPATYFLTCFLTYLHTYFLTYLLTYVP